MEAQTILSFYYGLAPVLWSAQKLGKEYKYIKNTNFSIIYTLYFLILFYLIFEKIDFIFWSPKTQHFNTTNQKNLSTSTHLAKIHIAILGKKISWIHTYMSYLKWQPNLKFYWNNSLSEQHTLICKTNVCPNFHYFSSFI